MRASNRCTSAGAPPNPSIKPLNPVVLQPYEATPFYKPSHTSSYQPICELWKPFDKLSFPPSTKPRPFLLPGVQAATIPAYTFGIHARPKCFPPCTGGNQRHDQSVDSKMSKLKSMRHCIRSARTPPPINQQSCHLADGSRLPEDTNPPATPRGLSMLHTNHYGIPYAHSAISRDRTRPGRQFR